MVAFGRSRWIPFALLVAAFFTALAAALKLDVPCWQASACREAMDYRLWGLPLGVWGCLFDALALTLWAARSRWFLPTLSLGAGIEIWLLHILWTTRTFCPVCLVHGFLVLAAFAWSWRKDAGLQAATAALAVFAVFVFVQPISSPRPALYAAHVDASPVVASIGELTITLSQLDGTVAGEIYRLERRIYETRRKKLEEILEQVVVAREAQRRGISPEELYRSTVKDVTLTPEEMDFLTAGNRPSEEDHTLRVQALLEKRQHVWKQFVQSLYERYGVEIHLSNPAQPMVIVDTQEGLSAGPPDAPVTVVEFSDYQCPVCREAHGAVQELMQEMGNQVQWVFMDYPLRRHRHARKAAEAARCAADQGRFLDYRNALYALSDPENLTPERLVDTAASLGLDTRTFRHCLESGRHGPAVEDNLQEAKVKGIDAIPAFIVNGRLILGFAGKETLAREITRARTSGPTRMAHMSAR
ncbi:Protein-disulfide isomerase [Desulfacinum hydrothermale DSM 13146]|uniref:Protein-disulfide isomerase n=1 Tax=Desulfacinum hydrothermale DSM 13146 TaxID=1121390 RepID=A0A1W1X6X9_9BACT|nr:thioredoxin domain-containing protein [Desulfacinum hydrothermale]SMC19702.1 Protein-disulfide isomerase [Desulfacinum hydrothermale DSM 13146]